jgi:hypothetical protein
MEIVSIAFKITFKLILAALSAFIIFIIFLASLTISKR